MQSPHWQIPQERYCCHTVALCPNKTMGGVAEMSGSMSRRLCSSLRSCRRFDTYMTCSRYRLRARVYASTYPQAYAQVRSIPHSASIGASTTQHEGGTSVMDLKLVPPIKGYASPKSQYFSQKATRNNVAIGPKSSEMRNQLRPLLFFPWAIPALINARLPHPIA